MKLKTPYYLSTMLCLLLQAVRLNAQDIATLEKNFANPPASAKPWVFWYWMQGAVSKEGITADLEAMKQVGIGGAYLMPIKDTSSTIPFQPTVRQLTPGWWQMVKFAMQEAKRLELKLAMHVSDGFALAGGPWITPELSMQKVVWTKEYIKAGTSRKINLSKPETNENYYKDIAVFAYPANNFKAFSDTVLIPSVTTSAGAKANFLSFAGDGKESVRCDSSCWIQYSYPSSFTCRSIKIKTGGNNFQARRLLLQSSNDGINYTTVQRLEAPRHGWQDTDEDYTYSIPATTATHFRFVYDKEGTEPGAEDLDAAKWKPSFKVTGIYLSDEPVINQYESKNGSVWRIATPTSNKQVTLKDAVQLNHIIDLTGKMDSAGNIDWPLPGINNHPVKRAGLTSDWVIVRIGHTSTGHTNATGGAAKGLECDKFNPAAIQLQVDNWFAKAFSQTDESLAKEVLSIFHVDSWECGSQNWGHNFLQEFKSRRGYDLAPWLLVMTGVPVQDAASSEKVLHDVRQTIAGLVNDIFYKTLHTQAQKMGCQFSAESVAPTMVSDGILHYKNTDIPMGEFWLNSPTHDKPNDMLDAISGAHIYGKNIVQAEAFTSVRMNWGEHPGNMKAIGDRNFALGINKMVLHVFTHNPWMNKKPGMTLDGVGLYFQRDQTWFKPGKAWIDYLTRCQLLLQSGKPVVDIAVFTGEEIPRRSLLPDRLVKSLPGIFGKEKVAAEQKRLANTGQPLRSKPDGVSHSANMADPEDWIDPLNGYAYDSFNPDVLMQMKVENGRVVTPGGASYAVLVFPNHTMSEDVTKKIAQLVKDGATILQNNSLPYTEPTFEKSGIQKDVEVIGSKNSIAWTHRKTADADIYFIANQLDEIQNGEIILRAGNKVVRTLDPLTGKAYTQTFTKKGNRTSVKFSLAANQSFFILIGDYPNRPPVTKVNPVYRKVLLDNPWTIQFDTAFGGPAEKVTASSLKSWTEFTEPTIKYYSGTAIYSHNFKYDRQRKGERVFIMLDSLYNLATVKINGIECGTIWTKPYHLEISNALKPGINTIEIEVSNTWHNRLIGDQLLPVEKKITWTTAPFRLQNKPLLPAGLLGTVTIYMQ